MAKIIFYKNPILEEDNEVIISKGTLRYALKELGIDKSPLSVSINGMTPEEIDLDLILDENDIVEIRRMVHGGNQNSESKSTLATIVQISALIAMFVPGLQPYALYILAGSTIVAGALNKWAQDLANSKLGGEEAQEAAIQSNDYSPKSATNKARPLAPMPLPIGSHRYAPDVQADIFMQRYNYDYDPAPAVPFLNYYENAGILEENGPMSPENSWTTMPANYIGPGIPKYPIKIAPNGFINKTTPLTPAESTGVRNYVLNLYLTSSLRNYTNIYYAQLGTPIFAKMGVIYHFDDNDPFKGRFNLLWSMLQSYVVKRDYSGPFGDAWSMMGMIFDNTFISNYGTSWGRTLYGSSEDGNFDVLSIKSGSQYTLPAYLKSSNQNQRADEFRNILIALNDGSYTTSPKLYAPDVQAWYFSSALVQKTTGIPASTQVFNFGIGDLEIYDRQVGNIPILNSDGVLGVSSVIKNDPEDWSIPEITKLGRSFEFQEDVKTFPKKDLINNNVATFMVPVNDSGLYNFNYFSGKYGMDIFTFAIAGRIYSTTPDGFVQNTTHLQVHYKYSDQEFWTEMPLDLVNYKVVSIQNNNTQNIYIPFKIHSSRPVSNDIYLEVRIRKITPDILDNRSPSASSSMVSNLSIVDATFYQTYSTKKSLQNLIKNIPMNLEGLAIDALINDNAATNQYSAVVNSKCWVFDFGSESWSWTFTRNPAFWFLYFARGGFLNIPSIGEYEWPYSPTFGWVNYPGHPDSTEHIFGGGYKDEEIDIDKILEWAFFCRDNDLKIDMIIKDDTSVADILERIANIGRASVTYSIGKLSVVIEDPTQAPVAIFGMGNIIAGSFSVNYSVGDPVRKVKATYINRENWESDEVDSFVPFSSEDVIKEISMSMDGITDKTQAQREVNILAGRQFYQRRSYTWETDAQGFLAKRGDIVLLSHDSTQYGFSGVIKDFIIDGNSVIGIKSSSFVDGDVNYTTIKSPDGELINLQCKFIDGKIIFEEEFPIEKAPFYISEGIENTLSEFPKSFPEDFTFISDIKQTTGKRVRIAQVECSAGDVFKFTAVDEDPALWAYEYNNIIPPESFDDSSILSEITDVEWKDLGGGKILLTWNNVNCDAAQIINLNINSPIEVNGSYSIFGNEAILDLIPGLNYKLRISPIVYSSQRTKSTEINIWPL